MITSYDRVGSGMFRLKERNERNRQRQTEREKNTNKPTDMKQQKRVCEDDRRCGMANEERNHETEETRAAVFLCIDLSSALYCRVRVCNTHGGS